MQLPRGTFYSLKKGMTLSSLLDELRSAAFSGHCSFPLGNTSGSLVFDRGTCILADVPPRAGTEACTYLQEAGGELVNAELYSLTPAQINLSIEFNAKFRVAVAPRQGAAAAGSMPVSPAPPARGPQATRRPSATVLPLQVPRGTFHAMKKGVDFSVLIDELREQRFSGYCQLTFADKQGTIVLEEGICLMADIPPHRGSDALQELQGRVDGKVSAELYRLTPAQMQLTLEFNRDYRVTVGVKGSLLSLKPQKVAERPPKSEEAVVREGGISDDFEEQMRAIESMDLDAMSERFKDTFRDVLNRMQLDYLLEKEEQELPSDEEGEGAGEKKEKKEEDAEDEQS
ncbi:MAG: hypothetical protein GKC04_09190 [Methanomicrobiales archaeon]|nr:hypothetical protein [Methanomicrobiales archaeon]